VNEGYALRHLGKLMNWSFEVENRETTWLRMMSDVKYDSYRDFWAGSGFAEALLNWIQQFEPSDRQTAYNLIRTRLTFVSFAEMRHLVSRTLPVYARRIIVEQVATRCKVPVYLVWARQDTRKCYEDTLARTLFIGLSDGARIDGFRRSNAGTVANDQVALGYELSDDKWRDLHDNLRQRTNDSSARFEVLFLIDDFAGSGKTLLRQEAGKWKGKLTKFAESYSRQSCMFCHDCVIAIHHYIGTAKAQQNIAELLKRAALSSGPQPWFPSSPLTSFDLVIGDGSVISRGLYSEIDSLVDRYYDPGIETKSIKVGGTDAKFGFAACGLSLVLEQNTPNNSLGLLWAESSSAGPAPPHRMRPLFRRRQRHT
jgi:hypothetical protein